MTLTINNKEIELKLTTRNTIALERELGHNPLQVIIDVDRGELPKLEEIVIIFKHMVKPSINSDKAYELFDEYLSDGHTMFDIVNTYIEVYKECGIIHDEQPGEEGKN